LWSMTLIMGLLRVPILVAVGILVHIVVLILEMFVSQLWIFGNLIENFIMFILNEYFCSLFIHVVVRNDIIIPSKFFLVYMTEGNILKITLVSNLIRRKDNISSKGENYKMDKKKKEVARKFMSKKRDLCFSSYNH